MNYDKPLQMDTSVKVYETPQIDITAEQFRDGYIKAFQETAKTVYAIGKKFGQVDSELAENKEYIRVDEEIANARAAYIKEYENTEKMNLSDENWRSTRDEALSNLRTTEFDIINNSKLNNTAKEKFAQNSNSYYREKGVKNTLAFGEYTRQANITLASQRISDNYRLFSETDNQSERDSIINSINNNKAILKKYGVNETEINSSIIENLSKSLKVATKTQIDNLFLNLEPEIAAAQANQLILDNAQKYTATIGQISGMEKTNAFEMMDSYYKEHKTFFGQYINAQKKKQIKNLKAQEKLKNDVDKTEKKMLGYINDYDVFKITEELEGVQYTTSQMLFDVDAQENLYGEGNNILSFGKEENFFIAKLVSEKDIDEIKGTVATLKNDGLPKDKATLSAIYGFANEKANGNEKVERALLKSLAYQFKINPKIVLGGKENPSIVHTWETVKKGDYEDVQIIDGKFIGKGRQRFDKLLEKSSKDKNPVSPEILAKYLSGLVERSQDPKIKERAKTNYNSAIYKILMDDEYYEEIENALPILYDVYISPIKYKLAPLKTENLIKKSHNNIINESIESEGIEDENNGFGIQ